MLKKAIAQIDIETRVKGMCYFPSKAWIVVPTEGIVLLCYSLFSEH